MHHTMHVLVASDQMRPSSLMASYVAVFTFNVERHILIVCILCENSIAKE